MADDNDNVEAFTILDLDPEESGKGKTFIFSAGNIPILKLHGSKNWDTWYNAIVSMCEMADVDGVLNCEVPKPTQKVKEVAPTFQKRGRPTGRRSTNTSWVASSSL